MGLYRCLPLVQGEESGEVEWSVVDTLLVAGFWKETLLEDALWLVQQSWRRRIYHRAGRLANS